jgi:hypothetical protein
MSHMGQTGAINAIPMAAGALPGVIRAGLAWLV